MTQNDNGPGLGWNYGETDVFTFGRKVWPKMGFKINHPKFLKLMIFILEKATFFFEHLFPVVAKTCLEYRSVFFWAQNLVFFGQKNPIFAIRPQIWSTACL